MLGRIPCQKVDLKKLLPGREVQPVRGPEKITRFWAAPEG